MMRGDRPLHLVTVAQVSAGQVDVAPEVAADLDTVVAWIRYYLAAPHPDLGRPGNVCPFIPQALERDTIHLGVEPGDPSIPHLARRMLQTLDWFQATAAKTGPDALYLTVVTILPHLSRARIVDVIEGVQALLKPQFLEAGAMIGEFHPLPPTRQGLWNPDFRPFACPFPALAIRHMVPADFPFVESEDAHVRCYLERFADAVPAHLSARVEERIESAASPLLPGAEPICSRCGHAEAVTHPDHAASPRGRR